MPFDIAAMRRLTDRLADVEIAVTSLTQGDHYGPWGPSQPDGTPMYDPELEYGALGRDRVPGPARRYLDQALGEHLQKIVERARDLARREERTIQEALSEETRVIYNPPGVGPDYTQQGS